MFFLGNHNVHFNHLKMYLEYVFYTSKVFEKIVFKSMKHPSSPFMIRGVFILPISESSCRCFSSRHQLANAFLLKFIQLHVNGQNGAHESPSPELTYISPPKVCLKIRFSFYQCGIGWFLREYP